MEIGELEYRFNPEQIAQFPLAQRDSSRLMVVNRRVGSIGHGRFRDLADFLRPGDLLVLNDAKVFPARLRGKRPSGGVVELVLAEKVSPDARAWLCLEGRAKRVKRGEVVDFGGGLLGLWGPRVEDGRRLVRFEAPGSVWRAICEVGLMPLPPYIKRPPVAADRERYQTIYARQIGAVAAPTAGLHFTERLLDRLATAGVGIAYLTLNVGVGTFLPIRASNVSQHQMQPESYSIPSSTAVDILRTRDLGGRVIAVGTTTTRALEGAALRSGGVQAGEGKTDVFITPGYRFRVVDCLVTNFHLPRSTPLALVMALAGPPLTRRAYHRAVEEGYRLYSFGDAMLIL